MIENMIIAVATPPVIMFALYVVLWGLFSVIEIILDFVWDEVQND